MRFWQCISLEIQDTLSHWYQISFWLSISGNSSEKSTVGTLLTWPIECWNYFDDSLLTAFRRSESNRANRFLLPPSLHSSKLRGVSDEHDTSLVLPLQTQNRKDVNWIIVTELDRACKCSKLPSHYVLTSTNQLAGTFDWVLNGQSELCDCCISIIGNSQFIRS